MHVVLVGDSVFDNAAYVGGGPDVRAQLERQLSGARVTLLAVDGSQMHGIPSQLAKLPRDATHLMVSVGGNDAMQFVSVINQAAGSIAEALNIMADIGDAFQGQYRDMMRGVLQPKLPAAFCTIYEPAFPDPIIQRLLVTGLTVFNDRIIREVFREGSALLDLRLVCTEKADFANEIEPSSAGGAKIASTIAKAVREYDFAVKRTQVFS